MAPVEVVRRRATVADLHAIDPFAVGVPDAPAIWWCDPVDAAVVLGSRQPDSTVDIDACRRAGLGVVRRRSGGGAVLVRPDVVVWADLVLPAGSLTDDVRASMIWAGERWREALLSLGLPADRLTVHTGRMRHTDWSELVCFAGVGPGEVLLDDRKLVGLSQRRTRWGARIQGQVHRRSVVASMTALLTPPLPAVALGEAAAWPTLDPGRLTSALAAAVTSARAGEHP